VSVVACADRGSGWVARSGAVSECGDRRSSNEDSFLIDSHYPFALVLDGMGGPGAGEMASRAGADAVSASLRRGLGAGDEPRALVEAALREGHAQVVGLGDLCPNFKHCGTTVVLTLLHRGTVYVSWLGDSAAYLVTTDATRRLTWEHDSRHLWMRRLGMSEDEARGYLWKNVLVYYLGGAWPEGDDRLEILTHTPTPGDRIVLTSDGVSKLLTDDEILAACRDYADPRACAERLVAMSLARGGYDNATCVVMTFDWSGDGPPPAPPRRRWQFWR
jgi:PPM family protein phosphatase